MRVERLRVALRARRGFEAVDLGLCMARAWWRPLALCWAVFVLPVGLVIVLSLVRWPGVALALLWWLRPAFGRIPLHVLSRLLFAEEVGLVDTARSLPGLARSGLPTSLFLQRLSPARTFLQPVLQLEGLRGAARRARCRVLSRADLGASAGLLAFGAHANLTLQAGLLLLVLLLLPEEMVIVPEDWYLGSWFDGEWSWVDASVPGLYLLGISLVEPLLVAGGFGLYLSRRVYLEGWDIELAFRGLATRIEGERTGAERRAPGLVACLLLAMLWGGPAEAQTACEPAEPWSAGACLEEVLASPDFARTRPEERWVLKEFESEPEEDPLSLDLVWLAELLAALGRLALWLSLGALVVLVVLALLRHMPEASRAPPPERPRPGPMGFDLDPGTLPDDPVALARRLFAAGEPVQALSLLYRAVLVDLAERRSLRLADSATELECLRAVERSQAPERVRDFRELTRQWMSARYAGLTPDASDFERLCLRIDHSLAVTA